jgi:hypothetical protein
MLKLSISCTRFESNYSSAASRSIENICSSSGAVEALMKRETGDETQFTTKIGGKTSLCPKYFGFVKFHSQLRI